MKFTQLCKMFLVIELTILVIIAIWSTPMQVTIRQFSPLWWAAHYVKLAIFILLSGYSWIVVLEDLDKYLQKRNIEFGTCLKNAGATVITLMYGVLFTTSVITGIIDAAKVSH